MDPNLAVRTDHGLDRLADTIAHELVRPLLKGDSLVVQTGVLMPSGRIVSACVSGGPRRFVVSDDGCAMRELAMAGRHDAASRVLTTVAKAEALKFTGEKLYIDDIEIDQINGFILIIAHAAARGVERALERHIKRSAKDSLHNRLRMLFGIASVNRNFEIVGSSTRSWEFDFEIARSHKPSTLLHVVSNNPDAIARAYTRFDDVSRLENAPRLGAVLDGNFEPSDLALLRRSAGRVIPLDASDAVFRRAA